MGKEIRMDGKQNTESKIKLDINDLVDIVCAECGSKVFRQVQMFKRLSALVSPTGKEQIVPVPTFRCDECGFINDEFLPKSEKK